jgi:aerobic-type carbon monoxide dehydrogenase small subunit (CoxS/CutS family)
MSIETRPDTELQTEIMVETIVNGQAVAKKVEARRMLLDFVRDDLGLKGAKRSCDTQVCGACTVLVDGLPVSACCTLAYEADGKQVTTIEGLSRNGVLDPVQDAFIAESAIQCGFCTPGMILAVKVLLEENPEPTREEIERNLASNLCRCTGYWNIIDAVERAAAWLKEGSG